MKKSYLVYAPLVPVFFVLGILLAQGSPLIFADLPSALLVLVPAFCLLLAVFGPRKIMDAFRIAFENTSAPRQDIEKGIVFFSTAQKLFLMNGFLGTMTGVLLILNVMSKADNTPVARYAVVAFLSVYYSLMLVVTISIPFKAALEKKLAECK